MKNPPLLISEDAIESLFGAAGRAHPHETGGLLIGVYADGQPWVTQAIELPSAEMGRNRYRISSGATTPAVEIARKSDDRLGYLGDWHSHPQDVPPSPMDLASLRLISHSHPRSPNPTLIVVRRVGLGAYRIDARRIVAMRARPCTITATGPPTNQE